jgi:hypothetical protein
VLPKIRLEETFNEKKSVLAPCSRSDLHFASLDRNYSKCQTGNTTSTSAGASFGSRTTSGLVVRI